MPVNTPHPLYQAHEARASRVRDAVAGTDAVKAKGRMYLPHPVAEFEQLQGAERDADIARYEAYLTRALWLGVTGRTHEGLLGAVFRKEPAVELPAVLDYLSQDADGSGMSLEQFAKMGVSGVLQSGRGAILADYPEAEDGLTREQTQGLAATLRWYSSDSIINWRRDGEELALVVLAETYEDGGDEFTSDSKLQYRVLRLTDGAYTQQVYREGQPAGEMVTPRRGDGTAWPFIPFQFLGAKNNDETPDKPPLLDLADVNLAHYRNSADLEEAAFIAGQPMLHVDIGEMSTDAWKELNPTGISIGSRRGVQTQGGGLSMVQAEERNILSSMMDAKEKQMVAIGARLIEQRGGNQTAEEVRARSGAENASLSSVATNVGDGIENALEWCAHFMARNGDATAEQLEFALNQEFYEESADPQEIVARMQLVDRGLLADTDFWSWGRKKGVIDPDRTDEDIRAEAEASGTNLGAL